MRVRARPRSRRHEQSAMMSVSIVLLVVLGTILLAVLALVVALVANQRAGREEATADIPGLDLAPPESMRVWRHRSPGPDGTTYQRAYATTLEESAVDAFYTEALADLGYEQVGDRRSGDVSPLQTILGDPGGHDVPGLGCADPAHRGGHRGHHGVGPRRLHDRDEVTAPTSRRATMGSDQPGVRPPARPPTEPPPTLFTEVYADGDDGDRGERARIVEPAASAADGVRGGVGDVPRRRARRPPVARGRRRRQPLRRLPPPGRAPPLRRL